MFMNINENIKNGRKKQENYIYNLSFDRAEMHNMCKIVARKYLKQFLGHYLSELTYFGANNSTKGSINSVSIATGHLTKTEIGI